MRPIHPRRMVSAVSALLVAVGALALLPLVTLVASAPPAGASSSEPYATWTTAQVDKYGPFSSSYPFDPNNPAPHPQVPLLTAMSCPSTSLCVAVDSSGSVVETTNDNYNAAVWTHMDIAGTNELTGVSCASTSMCLAVDAFGNIYGSTSPTTANTWVNVSGVTYSTGTVIDFTGVSCAGTSPNYVCAVVGNDLAGNGYLFVSTNPLSTTAGWSASDTGSANAYSDALHKINAVSCPTIYFCIAGDAAGNEIYNATGGDFGGNFTTGSWTNTAVAGGHSILSISCTAIASSYAADNDGDADNDAIAGLCAYGDNAGNIKTTSAALAFPNTTVGMATPGWTGVSFADGTNHVTTISCAWATTSMCEAGDNVGNFMASNNGAAWATVSSPGDSPNILEAISCGSPSVCFSVDDIGTAFVTTSAPGNWTKYGPTVDGVPGLSVVDGVNPILSITCPSSTLCLAGDAQGRILYSTTPSSGTGWTRMTQLGGNAAPISGLSCVSATFCVAIDQGAPAHLYVSTAPTSTWTAEGTLPNSGTVTGLSCPSTGLCVATEDGGAMMYSTNPNASGGGTWSNMSALDGSNNINGVSCASAVLCVAVDNKGNMVVNSNGNPGAGAASWATSSIDGVNPINAVSCVSGGALCVAADNVGHIVYAPANNNPNPILSPTTWATSTILPTNPHPPASPPPPLEVDTPASFAAVACPTTQICIAVGLDTGGSTASNATVGFVSQAGTNPTAGSTWCELEANSCGNGAAIGVDPGPIPQPTPPGASPYTVSALACSSGSACEAVDNAGDILTGTSGGLAVATPSMPAGVVNQKYNNGTPFAVTASGGVPNYRWQVSGLLPPGLTYAQSGASGGSLTISGTPTAAGTFAFSVSVSDSSNPPASASATLSITVMSNWTAPTLVDSGTSTGVNPAANLPAGQISCVSSSMCLEADGGGRVLEYNGTTWSAPQQADGAGDITGISCATSSFCALVDNCGNAVTGSSSNGGATWTWSAATNLTGYPCGVGDTAPTAAQIPLTAISCVSANPVFCVAVGGYSGPLGSPSVQGGVAYGYNGISWMQGWGWAPAIDPGGGITITSVSCVSSALCVATDNQGHWLDYGLTTASTWTADGAISTFAANPTFVSCYDASGATANLVCAAVDHGNTDVYPAGGPWGAAAGTDGANNTDSVSCTSDGTGATHWFCLMVDSSGNAFGNDNGGGWVTNPTGGAGWTNAVNALAFDFSSVSCTATTSLVCFAGSGTGSGAAMPPNQSGGEVLQFNGTSDAWCPGSGGCAGAPVKSDIVDSIDSMSCPTATLCVAGTANGQILAGVVPSGGTPNIGSAADWTDVVGPSYPAPSGLQPTGAVTGMSCAISGTQTNCFGTSGDNVIASTTPQYGNSWTSVTADTSGDPLTGISCPATSLCVVVDNGGHVAASSSPTVSGSWSTSSSALSGITDLTGISCLPDGSNTMCIATATGGRIAWTDVAASSLANSASWSDASVDGSNDLEAISCPSKSLCLAGDSAGNLLYATAPTGGGGGWTVTNIDHTYRFTSVSCLSTTFCIAGDLYGDILGSLSPTAGVTAWWNINSDAGVYADSTAYPGPDANGYFGPAVNAASCSQTSSSSPNSLCVVGDSYGRILTSASTATLAITPGGPFTGSDGAAIQPITLTASGGSGSYTWSPVSSLPPGLSLSSGGVISGTPTSASNYSFEVQVQDSSSPAQTATSTFSMTITTATLGVTTATLPGGTVGGSYSATVAASGGTPPYTWALATGSTLPAGLSLTPSNGLISGVPSAAGSTSFTVQVTDSASPVDTATAKLSITVTTTTTLLITSTSANPPSGSWTVGTNATVTLAASGGTSPYSWALASGSSLPAGLSLGSSGAITGTPAAAGSLDAIFTVTDSSSPPQVATAEFQLIVETNGCQGSSCGGGGGGGGGCTQSPCPLPSGYWMVGADGGVFNFPQNSLPLYGSASGISGGAAGMVATPDGQGYWVVSKTGTVEGFGDASSACTSATLSNVIGIIATADGKGCWIADSAGDVTAEGDAVSHGSISSISPPLQLAAPIVGITVTPDGGGYWLLGGDGGVFTFGDAKYFGSTSQLNPLMPPGGSNSAEPLDKPVVGIASTGDGHGYWEVAADGGIFSFGDAAFYGSQGGTNLYAPVVGMVVTPSGHGYWLVASDGGIFTHGDAQFYGALGGKPLFSPIVGMAGP